MGLDLSALKPLNAQTGTKNFAGYREKEAKAKRNEDAMDSDADDEDDVKVEDAEDDKEVFDKGMLSPEDAHRQGELAEGVRKIKVCLQSVAKVAILTPHSSSVSIPQNL